MTTLEDQMPEERKKAQLDRELILESMFRKWNPVALGCKAEHGARDCPLCFEYRVISICSEISCAGCPIEKYTGQPGCEMTPYDDLDSETSVEEQYDIIEAEIEFLISLLSIEDQENIENLHKRWIKEQKDAVQ